NALAGLQDLDRAVSQIQEAIDLDPNRSGSYMNLAALLFARRSQGAAEQAFKKATEIAPQLADTHLALANYYWASGRMAEAEMSLRHAGVVQPTHVGANRALATFYLASNRAAEAEQHFKAVAELSGTSEARLSLADYYLLTRRSKQAMPILEDLATDPRAFAVAKARIAAVHHAEGRREQAHATIDEALAKAPNDKVALLIKARMLLAENRPDEALPRVQAAIAVDPAFAPAHFTLGSIFVARHDVVRAQNAFSQVLRLNPRAVAAQLALSRLHLQQGGFQSSVNLAQEAVATQPDNALAHLLLARALMGRGDLNEAEARMKALLDQSPSSAPVHAQMGTLMLLRKDPKSAQRFFALAAELDPGLMEALTGLVTIDIAERRYSDARARIEDALRGRPRDPERLLLASGVYTITGDDSAAEDTLKTLIEVDPSNMKAYGQLALLYYRQNRLEEALVEFEELARRQTTSVAPRTMLGMILQVAHKLAEAEPHYEEALNIDPTAAVAANNLAWIYSETGGSLDTALQLAQTAKLHLPDLAEVDDTLGWIYYKKEMITLAVPRLEETVRRAPRTALYQFHLGMAYAKQGRVENARRALQQALALDPNLSDAAEARKALAELSKPMAASSGAQR
ncbi:MAG: tetratricopeptide repeat protein, partial [Vicinamibacterales bacterium]